MILINKRFLKKCFIGAIVLLTLAVLASFVFYFWIAEYEIYYTGDIGENIIFDTSDLPEYSTHYVRNKEAMKKYESQFDDDYFSNRNITVPIIIWWTPFTLDIGSYRKCGKKNNRCFFTNVRKYRDHEQAKAFLYYGSDFYLNDLPLPRRSHEEWALLHEESPKNNYLFSFGSIMEMFNHTATFKRESDMPITTQYLTSIEDIENKKFLKTTEHKNKMIKESNLAPVAYVQSDCYTPSNRDLYVKALMKHIKVDSYGRCLHNKNLPDELTSPVQTMNDERFYELLSNYKFIISIENAICDDYVTEKLWRTYYVGSVPIILANHDRIDSFLPTNKSAINVKDFETAEDLAKFLNRLNENDAEYEEYLSYKGTNGVKNQFLKDLMAERTWGINNDPVKGNFIDSFECVVCERLHENLERESKKLELKTYQASKSHYGCPHAITFDAKGRIITIEDAENAKDYENEMKDNDFQGWSFTYLFAYSMQHLFFNKYMPNQIYNFTAQELREEALKHYHGYFVKNKSSRIDL